MDGAILNGEGIRLRPWTAADAEAFCEICGDPDIPRFLSMFPSEPTPEFAAAYRGMAREAWAGGKGAVWAIEDTGSGQVEGSIELFRISSDEPTLGYWVRRDSRGRGLATGGCLLALRWARRRGVTTVSLVTHFVLRLDKWSSDSL